MSASPNFLPDVRSVVKELGGARAAAKIFRVTENAVWVWTGSNRLPAHTYLVIKDRMRRKRKVVPDSLFRMAVDASEIAKSSPSESPSESSNSEGAAA